VDLATLRAVAEHPPFDRADLETPVPAPSHIPDPPEPIFRPPSPAWALRGLLGGKKHETAVAEALAAHEVAVTQWKSALVDAESARKAAASQHADLEAKRLAALQVERARYAQECTARESRRGGAEQGGRYAHRRPWLRSGSRRSGVCIHRAF